MANDGKKDLLFLTRDHIYFYEGSNVLNLELPANLVHDIDVRDRDGLYAYVLDFIQKNKLIPSQIYFVLSESVCFSADIPLKAPVDEKQIDGLVKEFTDSIPFSAVVSKTYKTAANVRVIGANQEIINIIFDAFGSKGFGISALIPAAIFPEIGARTDITPAVAQGILAKKEIAIANSMVGEKLAAEQQLATSQTAVPKNKMLPWLVGTFFILIAILIIVIFVRK